MDNKDFEEMLDRIDEWMINHINKDSRYLEGTSKKDMEEIESTLLQLKNIENQSKRLDVLMDAYYMSKTGATTNEQGYENAQKYYKWISSIYTITDKNDISTEEALKLNDIALLSGHQPDSRIISILEQQLQKNTLSENTLPKKQNMFDKIKQKILKFFNRNKRSGSKNNNTPTPNVRRPQNTTEKTKSSEEELQPHEEYIKTIKISQKEINDSINNTIDNNYKSIEEEQPKNLPDVVVVSDLHGNREKWEMVKANLRANPNRKIIMLGDAMDRGDYGVEILMEIKDLADEGKIEYLPGNHDVFAYNTLITGETKYEDTDIARNSKLTWEHNGGKTTIEKFRNFDRIMQQELYNGKIKKSINKEELINWLGSRPIQKVEYLNNMNYALAHAMFDEKLYMKNPEFNLRDALVLELAGKQNSEELKRFDNCMWYREHDSDTHYMDVESAYPKDHIVVCGHTRQTEANLQNIEKDPYKPIIYIDCGKGKLQGFNLNKGETVDLEPDPDKDI